MSFNTFHTSSQIYYTIYLDVVREHLIVMTGVAQGGRKQMRGLCGLTWKRGAEAQTDGRPVFPEP
jgi:hypothetical protein